MTDFPVLSDLISTEQRMALAKEISDAQEKSYHVTVILQFDKSGLHYYAVTETKIAPPGKPPFMQKNTRYNEIEES